MLKHILLCCAAIALLAFGQAATAQTVHFSEDFENGIPATWTILDGDGLTPSPDWPNTGAGGCDNVPYPLVRGWEGYCGRAMSISWYQTPGTSDDWLFTEAITIPANVSNAFLRWTAFTINTRRQPSRDDDYAVRIGTTNNPADHVANVLFSNNNTLFDEEIVDISQWIGQTVYISFQNFATNKYCLMLEEMEVLTLLDRDVRAISFDNFPYLTDMDNSVDVEGVFFNAGGQTITDLEINYSVDGGPAVTTTLTGLNITPYSSASIVHPTTLNFATDGGKDVRYWVSTINGQSDLNPNDNELNKGFTRTSAPVQRNILVETFTSSSCGPCNAGNANLEGVLGIADNPRIISIKHQSPIFPPPGDPYATDEQEARFIEYAIPLGFGGIPHTIVDGGRNEDFNPNPQATPFVTVLNTFNGALTENAFGDIVGTYRVDVPAQTVHIDADFIPATDLTGAERLQVAIIELKTRSNATTNGETEFENGVRKMLPNQDGTMLSTIAAGTPYSFDQVYTFQGNYRRASDTYDVPANRINHAIEHCIEEFEDLAVVAWVENAGELFVLNAGRLTRTYAVANDAEFDLAKLSVAPNPATDFANIDITLTEATAVALEVVNVEGKVVMTKDAGTLAVGNNSVELNVSDLPAGTYHVTAKMEKGMITRPLVVVR
jgi:hypothetical protein